MDGGIEFLEVVHHAAGHLGLVHHLRQHHEHGFEDVAGVGGKFGPTLPVTLEVALHRQIEQPFLVAEQFVQRTLRYAEMLCDIVHAHGFDALRGEHLHRLVDNAFFLGRGHVFSRFIRDKYNKKTHGTKKVFCFLQFFQPIMSRTSRNGDKQNNPGREKGPERRRIE